MSLRYQINLRILFVSLCVLVLGGSIAIWQARHAVEKEVGSSIKLAVQLISVGFFQPSPMQTETQWLQQFAALKETRHLSIEVKAPSGERFTIAPNKPQTLRRDLPPPWFVSLVQGQRHKAEHLVTTVGGKQLALIIQANPLDEITEVWEESVGFFSSLLLLAFFTFLAVNLAFDQALKSIAVIVNALKIIETGNYQQKLPDFSILEYDSIAKAINHMTGELRASQLENRALTQHSLAIQEDERQRLSQELHDELGQSLTAIKVMAATIGRPAGGATSKTSADAIIGICDHLMGVVRSMMHQLHPLVLTELGLKATMEDLLNHWAIRNPALKLGINCPEEVDAIDKKITIQVFRVVQECLTNIMRHAQASQATINLEIVPSASTTDSSLRLCISDNGVGGAAGPLTAGFGLLGMRERINSLGGELTVDSQPQQGTSITASIPL